MIQHVEIHRFYVATNSRFVARALLLFGVNFLVVGTVPASPEVSGYVQVEYGPPILFPVRHIEGKWAYPPGPLKSIDFDVSQNGDSGSLNFSYIDLGPGAGAISWKLRETITGSYNPIAEYHQGEGRLTFDAVPNNGPFYNHPDTSPLPLPPGTGTLRWRHSFNITGLASAYTHLWIAGNNAPGTGWLESFYAVPPGSDVNNFPPSSSARREIPFYEGDTLRIQLGAYLSLQGNLAKGDQFGSSTGIVFWTSGPSFPGDTTGNPVTNQTRQTPTFTGVDTSGDEPPPASDPSYIAGIDLTAPSRGVLAATAAATDANAVRVSVLDAPVVGDAGISNSIFALSVPPSSPGGTVALAARLTGEKSAVSAALTSVSQEVLFRAYGLNVAAFEIPFEAGQDGRLFSLIFGSQEVPYSPGTLFHFTDYFANGVANFRLRSLDGTGFADTVAGLPFVHGFRFVGEGVAQVWEVNVPAVPEPTTGMMAVILFQGILARCRRSTRSTRKRIPL